MRSSRSVALALLLGCTVPLLALAAFPDVPSSHPGAVAIHSLTERGIIRGNPDGTFRPEGLLNRAEFLTILYRAKNVTPSGEVGCFKDVPNDAWYAAVVCDAARAGYVAGYPDRTFRPSLPVSKVEAIKMILTVLGLPLTATTASDSRALSYQDLTPSAWYMSYVPAALELQMVPLPEDSETLFQPAASVQRWQAAVLVARALKLPANMALSSLSSSSVSSSTSVSSEPSASATSSRTSSTLSSTSRAPGFINLPTNVSGSFSLRTPEAFRFSLRSTQTYRVLVESKGSVNCRLFKIDPETDFSTEYYLGVQGKDSCTLLVTLSAGTYQLDAIPGEASSAYRIGITAGISDGSDGFSQAKLLPNPSVRTQVLDANETGDFFTFTLAKESSLLLSLNDDANLRCMIFPLADVDLYGFSQPACNAAFTYPVGTYVIAITHAKAPATRRTYTLQLQSAAQSQ